VGIIEEGGGTKSEKEPKKAEEGDLKSSETTEWSLNE
jgi:hypothetical protein